MIRDWLTPDKIKVINSIDSWEKALLNKSNFC